MRARAVLDRVLDELEPRQTDVIERHVVGRIGVRQRHGGRAQIVDGVEPLREQRRGGAVALGVDAADFPGAVVEIEVDRQLIVIGGLDDLRLGPAGAAAGRLGRGLFLSFAEMFGHVRGRTVQALFFAGPERDADGSAGMQVERLDDPDGLHRAGGPAGVVGRAGAAVPGIQVPADHHDLVFQIRSGNFRDRVGRAVWIGRGELA